MIIFFLLVFMSILAFCLGRNRAVSLSAREELHSRVHYYGFYALLWCALPALALMLLWIIGESQFLAWGIEARLQILKPDLSADELGLRLADVLALSSGGISRDIADPVLVSLADDVIALREKSFLFMVIAVCVLSLAMLVFALSRMSPDLRARVKIEKFMTVVMAVSSAIAILTTVGIVLSLLFESLRFFDKVPVTDFLFGLHWSPQTALRADQVGASGSFGAIPLFAGTLLITFIAMMVAVPVGLFAAIYMSEYAGRRFRGFAKPMLEILAGIPTVVYGFFAALTVAPFFRQNGTLLGLDVSSESALAAGVVMGVMIIPFVSSLSDDVMNAVPQSLRDGSYGMGATKSETIRLVILPAALPGIVGAVLLAMSRAIGETMIVVMAAGLAAKLTANPLEAVTTVTVQIVTLLVGDQEFDSAKTLAAFALGLVLFFVTLGLNVIALRVVRKYRERYD